MYIALIHSNGDVDTVGFDKRKGVQPVRNMLQQSRQQFLPWRLGLTWSGSGKVYRAVKPQPKVADKLLVTVIIITIITIRVLGTIYTVLSLYLEHCKNSRGECRNSGSGCRPLDLSHKPACRQPVNYIHHHHLLLLLSVKADSQ